MIVVRVAVRFFVRLYRIFAGILTDFKKNLCDITENMAVNRAAKAQPFIVRCCLKDTRREERFRGGLETAAKRRACKKK